MSAATSARARAPEPERRRTRQPVHRRSVDVDTAAAHVLQQKAPRRQAHRLVTLKKLKAHAAKRGGWTREHHAAQLIPESLYDHRNHETQEITPSYARLAEITGFCVATVKAGMKLLAECGLVGWLRRFVQDEPGQGRDARYRQTSNAYWLTLPEGEETLLAPRNKRPPLSDDERDRRERQARLEAGEGSSGCPNRAARLKAQRMARVAVAPAATAADDAASIARMLGGVGRPVRVAPDD